MTKHTLLCLICVLVLLTSASGETYRSKHFIIHSDLDPRFVHFVQANCEAFYENMVRRYFKIGWYEPLFIYYSKSQSDTRKLLKKHGLDNDIAYGRYVGSIPAVYTHRLMDGGGGSGWGTLFHEVTHHFMKLNFKRAPAWFNEGLASFLGEQTRIVRGELTVGLPNPWREQILRDKIENGFKPNVKRLCSMSSKGFYNWSVGYHFARALFYWLHEKGYLQQYLKDVHSKGYELSVLEGAVSKSYKQISIELLRFIRKDCYAGAYLKDGQAAKGLDTKEQAFIKALELKADYRAAQLELARHCYHSNNYEECQDYLRVILNDSACKEYHGANKLMGHCFFISKDYKRASKYYQKALEYSEYYEYGYELYYWMANCHHYMKDYARAKKLHKVFLDNNWEPEKDPKKVAYAKKYQKWEEKKGSEED